MNKILVDTSVWIDAFNGKESWQTKLLGKLIDNDANIVLCPVIVQEILQGIKDDKDFKSIKENLTGFEMLVIDPLADAYGAASLYRNIRKRGVTIRKSNDCLIAFYAVTHKAILLHNEDDFNKIAHYSSLKILCDE